MATIRWRAKLSTRRPEPRSKPFGVERGRERMQPGLLFAHGDGADHGAEDQPRRRRVLVGARRPAKTRPADQSAVDRGSRPASRR